MIVKSKWQIIKKSMKKSFLAALINRFYREIQTNIFRIYDFFQISTKTSWEIIKIVRYPNGLVLMGGAN